MIPRRKDEGKSGRRPTIHSHELGGPRKRKAKTERGEEQEQERIHIGRSLDGIEALGQMKN